MLLALTSGHAGMATVHAENPNAALTRLKTLAGMASESPPEHVLTDLIVGAIQLVVHLQHDLTSGRRVVSSIVEVTGKENEQPLANEIFTLKKVPLPALSVEDSPSIKEFTTRNPSSGPAQSYLAWTGTMPRCYWKLAEVGLDWERQIVRVEEEERKSFFTNT